MATIEVDYDPITINSGPVDVTIQGLNDIKADTKLTLEVPHTIKTDDKISFTISEPIRSETKADLDVKADVDLKPVVLDQCLRLSLGPLPQTHICMPVHQHLRLTLFGIEIFGVALNGEARFIVGEPQRQTHIVSGGAKKPEAGEGFRLRLDR